MPMAVLCSFSAGVTANLLVTRDATGLFSAYLNGGLAFSVMDPTGSTTFSGLNNRIWFFVDDFQSLFFYPDSPDAGSGFIDFIRVSTPEGEFSNHARSHASTSSSPALRHRSRRVRSAWLAQEAEASRLINLGRGRSTLGRKLGGFLLAERSNENGTVLERQFLLRGLFEQSWAPSNDALTAQFNSVVVSFL